MGQSAREDRENTPLLFGFGAFLAITNDIIIAVMKYCIAGIFARENFANYRLFAKILSANVLFLLTKIGQ